MICIARDLIEGDLGLSRVVSEALYKLFPQTGVLPCALFSFNDPREESAYGRSPLDWLSEEDSPCLLLIGMSDRAGDGCRATERPGRHPELDSEHSGVPLHDLLTYDQQNCDERPGVYRPFRFSAAQREAVDNYRRKTPRVREIAVAASGLYSRTPTPEEVAQLRALITAFGWEHAGEAARLLGLR